ncbi:hypothetical protein QFZ30_001492 [Arthrobacter pascens]|uniref:hypothetical protein n=1 Tax=Arthrobacter pascens TaxID=1677 RepID=UPI002790EE79|nr:hypothetical protein [Arthrobacter pascens]MDQ0678110.1 hypothetical protein [Arthrobacter pascens]
MIRGAIDAQMGVQLMLHPVYVDTTGYMTAADVESVFANIASLRDSRQLEVLMPSGLLIADRGSEQRQNLIANGSFKSTFTSWADTTGWSVVISGKSPSRPRRQGRR